MKPPKTCSLIVALFHSPSINTSFFDIVFSLEGGLLFCHFCQLFLLDIFCEKQYLSVKKKSFGGLLLMESAKMEWRECELLCGFLAAHVDELSKETEEMVARRALQLIQYATGLDKIPEPY